MSRASALSIAAARRACVQLALRNHGSEPALGKPCRAHRLLVLARCREGHEDHRRGAEEGLDGRIVTRLGDRDGGRRDEVDKAVAKALDRHVARQVALEHDRVGLRQPGPGNKAPGRLTQPAARAGGQGASAAALPPPRRRRPRPARPVAVAAMAVAPPRPHSPCGPPPASAPPASGKVAANGSSASSPWTRTS